MREFSVGRYLPEGQYCAPRKMLTAPLAYAPAAVVTALLAATGDVNMRVSGRRADKREGQFAGSAWSARMETGGQMAGYP